MNKSKLTLVIDGNWLLMSRLSVINDKFLTDKQLTENLLSLMTKSIKVMLRLIPKIDNIVFVADGGSWRCDVPIPKFLEDQNITYKGNREMDSETNWDVIWSAYGDFIELMSKSGITTAREFGIEGDDWCWAYSRKLNEQGTNVIIWSMDKDLSQLVQTNSEGVFTVTWNKSYMTTVKTNDDEMDFLFNFKFSENESLLDYIKRKSKEVKEIDPHEIIVDKIIRGDGGDNILPIILKDSKTNPEKKFRVRTKEIDYQLDVLNENAIDNYLLNLLESKSYKGKIEKSYQDIFDHFKYNRTLVMLDKSSYPEEILEILENPVIKEPSTNISFVENELIGNKLDINPVFDEI